MDRAIDILTSAAPKTYLKILKINITTDTFELWKEDKEIERGLYKKASSLAAYFSLFADQKFIHKDDEIDFRRATSINILRDFFHKNHHKDIYLFT